METIVQQSTEPLEALGCPEQPNYKQKCILTAAADVFFREGYERASVDQIAAEGNVSKRTIYNYFPDKRALFLAVIAYKLNPGLPNEILDPATLRSRESIRDDLTQLATRAIDSELDPELAALRRVLVTDVIRMPELTGACQHLRPTMAIEALGSRLAELFPGQLTGEEGATAISQMLGVLGAQAQARSAFWSLPVPDETRERIVQETVDLILRAYRLEP
jgi:TetR/AcrR family transcriptional repressor of mexJK operon